VNFDVVEWVTAGFDSKNIWSFCCFLAKITSLVYKQCKT